jgi:hypothetical protein
MTQPGIRAAQVPLYVAKTKPHGTRIAAFILVKLPARLTDPAYNDPLPQFAAGA